MLREKVTLTTVCVIGFLWALLALQAPAANASNPGSVTWSFVTIPGLPGGVSADRIWSDRPGNLYVWEVRTLPGTSDVPESFLYHWNGTDWEVQLHLSGFASSALFGTGPTDIFAAASGCERTTQMTCPGGAKAVMYHSADGVTWENQLLPTVSGSNTIMGIGGAAQDVQAGMYGSPILGFNGVNWALKYTAQTYGILTFFMLNANEGYYTSCAGHGWWDGTSWHEKGDPTFCDLYDLWGTRDGAGQLHLYTVGNNNFSNGVRVWKYNPDAQLFYPVYSDGNAYEAGSAYAVWGSAANDVYVGGRLGQWGQPNIGAIYHYDGTDWQRLTEFGGIPIVHDIWGTSANDVWFALVDGRLLHRHLTPIANAGGPYAVEEGSSVDLAGQGSDPSAAVLTFAWDLDSDGVFETPGQNPTFSAAGMDGPVTRDITLRVCDEDGVCDTSGATVTIDNVAPVVSASFAASPVGCGIGNATMDVSFADQGLLDTHSASIDWGDGSAPLVLAAVTSPFSAPHTYITVGSYTAIATVTDKDGGYGSASAPLVVNYTILSGGVLPPINQDGSSVFRYRSTVPVKIKVQDCSGSYPASLAPRLQVFLLSNDTPASQVNEPYSTSAADTTGVMRFSGTPDNQYIYNLATRSLPDPNARYRIVITLSQTGQTISVDFGVRS